MNHFEVEKMFWESCWKAEEQGLKAVKVLLGPEADWAFRQFFHTMGNLGFLVNDPACVGKPETYNGLPVGRMRCEGVAVLTRTKVKFKVVGE